MKKKILLNRMYCGNYLNTDGNIGHEVINLFKDDNGNNYIYIMSDGTIAMNHNDSIKTILLVRWIGNHLIEILAKAEDLKQIIYKNIKGRSDREKIHNEQIKYIKENNITYGNIRVDKLFKGNIYQGGDDETIALYATFITKKLRKPKQAIYITDKKISNEPNNTFLLEGKNFSRQSPKMYYEEGTISYETLEKIINTDELWEDKNTTKPINADLYVKEENKNFLTIIKKEYDELVFSNLLQYYFMLNKKMFKKFCRDVLNIINISDNYITERETKNIDLLIQDENNVIVIENKIKSGINGIRHDINSKEIESQLCKYYEYAKKISKKRKVYCFIFSPNYNYLDISNHKSNKYYKIIEYSKIYDFFSKNKIYYEQDKYFNDFLSALSKHTHKVNNELFEEMQRKFSMKIKKLNKN